MKNAILTTAALGLASVVSVAQADLTEAFRVDALSANGSSSFVVHFDDGSWEGGVWTYELDDQVDLNGVGMIQSATIVIASGNRSVGQTVSLNFNVVAGALNTVFSVTSGTAAAGYLSAMGQASAGVSVTDTLGDGATLSPDGTSVYTAYYNGLPGTQFAGLLNSAITAGAFSTATANAQFPGGGSFAPIVGPVNDISASWTFAVSAFDVATGTSVFTIVPSPASLALLGMGGLAIRRRR
ncbi:MAG: hypothetical protein Kow0022_10760 [Phycisphaerales bacterium]